LKDANCSPQSDWDNDNDLLWIKFHFELY
jgi:hypothetical protein